MLLWSNSIGAESVDFVVTQLFPNTGYVFSKADCQLHQLTNLQDAELYTIHGTAKFPAPAVDIFWAYLDESYLPDGTYLAQCTPSTGPVTTYSFNVVGGVERYGTFPAGVIPNIATCVVSGRELDPSGAAVRGVMIQAAVQDPSATSSGSVSGFVQVESAVDGTWSLPLIPSSQLRGDGSYIFRKLGPGRPVREFYDVVIPDATSASFDTVLATSFIAANEIATPFQPAAPPRQAGYATVTGRIVDVAGVPKGSVSVLFGVEQNFISEFAPRSGGFNTDAAALQVKMESQVTARTAPDLVLTKSAYPGASGTSLALEPGAFLAEVRDGNGDALGRQKYNYDPVTGVITFASPFVGIVKYRVATTGVFSINLKTGCDYWVQVGNATLRRAFALPEGTDVMDIGELTWGAWQR